MTLIMTRNMTSSIQNIFINNFLFFRELLRHVLISFQIIDLFFANVKSVNFVSLIFYLFLFVFQFQTCNSFPKDSLALLSQFSLFFDFLTMIYILNFLEYIIQSIKQIMNNEKINICKSNFVNFTNDNIYSHFSFLKEIGKGSYGVVYSAREKAVTNKYRAIKKINKRGIKNQNYFRNQIRNLTLLDHPTIIKIYEVHQDQNSLSIVTDLCQGGQLYNKLDNFGPFSQNDAKKIFGQLIEAINYCHKQKIAHRDIKPQNIMFTDKEGLNMKLVDFGLSFKYQNDMRQQLNDQSIVGTSYYVSPEIIAGSYDQRCDIWAAGVILYILVSSVPPFSGETDKDIITCIKKGKYSFDFPEIKRVSDQCKDLIKKILVPQSQRLTIEQIFDHPWMKKEAPKEPLQIDFHKLSEFGKYSKLKKITANFIASKLSQKQVEDLSNTFRNMDLDHDGYISLEELEAVIDSKKESVSYHQLKQLLIGIDTNRNGKIDYTQFIASSLERVKLFTEEHLTRAFQMIDLDGNGKIDKNQLKILLEKNSCLDGKQIQQVMAEYDDDRDGEIDFNEFVKALDK